MLAATNSDIITQYIKLRMTDKKINLHMWHQTHILYVGKTMSFIRIKHLCRLKNLLYLLGQFVTNNRILSRSQNSVCSE